jgi:hypothetical protein
MNELKLAVKSSIVAQQLLVINIARIDTVPCEVFNVYSMSDRACYESIRARLMADGRAATLPVNKAVKDGKR